MIEDSTPSGGAFGDREVRVHVAGMRVDFEGLDASLESLLRERYRGFLGTPVEDGAVRVSVRRAGAGSFIPWRPGRDPVHRLETTWEGGRLRVRSYGFAAEFDPPAARAVLSLVPEPPDPRHLSFENFLRVLVSWLALETGGFLFHSAALVREGEAYLFFGPSGAGKTTCCRLTEGLARPLNDDLVLLHRPSAERWEAAAVPFTGKFGRDEAGGTSFPVAGLYRLVQDVRTEVVDLGTAAAVADVLASVPFMEERPTDGVLADRVERLVRAVPVHRLHFRKDPGFWDEVLRARALRAEPARRRP